MSSTVTKNKLLYFLLLQISIWPSYSQVDVTKYASDDLFEVKPIFSQSNFEEDQKDEDETSFLAPEIEKGMVMWGNGDYDDAVAYFEKLESNYGSPTFTYFIGLINYERGRYDEATENFQETLRKEPLFLEASYMQGMIKANKREYKEANKIFRSLTEIHKYKAHGYHGLAITSLNQAQPYLAIKNFNKCIQSDSSYIEAYIPLASLHIYLRSYKKARKVIEDGIDIDPTWEKGIMVRAMISLFQDENSDQFESDVNRLIEIDPTNYHYYSIKGYLQIELNEYHEAVKQFHKAYNLERDSVRRGTSKFSSKFKKDESMHRSLNYYFDNYGQNESVRKYLDRGICEFLTDNRKQALQYLDSAASLEKNPVVFTFIGSINRTSFQKTDESIDAFTQALNLDSNNWIAHSYRGEALLKKGDFESAFKDYTEVIRIRPKSKEGYKSRGNILLQNNLFVRAYRDFSYALAIDTTDYDVFFNRAIALKRLNKNKDAINDLFRIVNYKPKDSEANYFLSECLLSNGDSLMALYYLDSASKYSRYSKNYHEELIELASKLAKPQQIENGYDRLVKYFSRNNSFRLRRAKYFINKEKYHEAEKDLNVLVKRDRKSGEAYYYLALVSKSLSKQKDYERYIKKADKLGFKPPE